MNKSGNKKGQGMSISTIILLILGVIVLVVLALGFSVGWSKILPFVSQDNVNAVSQQCSVACTTNDVFGFCTKVISLTTGGQTYSESCYNYSMKANYASFKIAACPTLPSSCPALPAQ